MPIRFHALAALMLRNFRFSSFLERAHSDFQIREFRFNHQMRCNATQFSHCSVTSPLQHFISLPLKLAFRFPLWKFVAVRDLIANFEQKLNILLCAGEVPV